MRRIRSIGAYAIPLCVLTLLLVLAACDTSAGTTPAGGVTPGVFSTPTALNSTPANTPPTAVASAVASPTAQAAASTVIPSPAPKETFDTTIVYGNGDFDFANPAAGLADLANYQATLTMQFDGRVNGQPLTWSKTYVMLTSKNPQARRLSIERSRGTAKLDPFLLAELDGASYTLKGTNPCTARPIDPGNTLADQFEPALGLAAVIGATRAGSETVNGAAADHYTFDQGALGEDGLSQASGELWVAVKGGYLVKYRLTRKGQPDYFGPGIEGTETLDYALIVPDKPLAVDVPATCPPGMVNAPLLPDAANVDRSLGMLSYQSAMTLANAAAFYQQELPKQGWTHSEDPSIATAHMLLSYKQGNRLMSVNLTARDGGGISVNIAVIRVQE